MTDADHRPRLRIYLRSHAGENRKGRPEYYDKTLCLLSLGRAAAELGSKAEVVFVNDGPVRPEHEGLMTRFGEVIQIRGGNNRASYRTTLALAAAGALDDVEVIWFGEDDYLYRRDAFVQLLDAAADLPSADYFALYCGELGSDERKAVEAREVRGEKVVWHPAISTTSSFAVRARHLREDLRLLRLMPFTGGAFDYTTCLALQGRYPFSPQRLRRDFFPMARPVSTWPRSIARGTVRVALGTRAFRRPDRRRVLYAPDRDLAAHLEVGGFDPADGWEDLARETRDWALAQGHLPVDTSRFQS